MVFISVRSFFTLMPVFVAVAVLALCVGAPASMAQDQDSDGAKVKSFRDTDLPLPRFVSLRSNKTHMRTGPGQRYPIKWFYQHAGLPVEIIQEFENWRKIRDNTGEVGWVHKSLLSGRRTVIVIGSDVVKIYDKKSTDSSVVAKLEPNVTAEIEECVPLLCEIKVGGYTGWIERKFIWGIYEHEELN